MAKTTLIKIDGQSAKNAIEAKGLTQTQISRIVGVCDSYTSNYLSRNLYSQEAIDRLNHTIGLDLSEFVIKEEPKPKADPQPKEEAHSVTIVEANYEPIITAIGQATAILSNQLNEIVKQLKQLNESRDEELKTISSAMQRSLTDSMVNAVILGLQESRGSIADGVKSGISNSGELRNAITQGIKNANKRY